MDQWEMKHFCGMRAKRTRPVQCIMGHDEKQERFVTRVKTLGRHQFL